MAFLSTTPKLGDSDNSLLFKIAQSLDSGGGGGGGDSVWEFSGGSLHPITDTQKITSNAGNLLLDPAAVDGTTPFGFNTNAVHTSGYLFVVANDDTPKLTVGTDGGIVSEGGITLNGAASIASGKAVLNGEIADGSTPYLFNTSIAHTSGFTAEFKNAGTFGAGVYPSGNLRIGKNTDSFYGVGDGGEAIVCVRDVTLGEAAFNGFFFAVNTANGANVVESALSASLAYYHLQAVSALQRDEITYQAKVGDTFLETKIASVSRFKCKPDAAASATAYLFDSSVNHTSGLLLDVKNNGTSKASVDFAGALNAVSYKVGGVAGASGTATAVNTLTIVNGIVTSIA